MIHPQKNRSKSDFVSEINENLSSCLELIQQRQEILYENPDHEFDHNTIPISVREQLNVLIQIGNINKKTTQFLFPDLDPEGIVIPIGKGTGLIQILDNEHPYQVLPLLCPTYYTKKGIL